MTINKKEMLRWGYGIRANPDFAREKILNAAIYCCQTYDFHKIGMAEIAREAKVTRATIYRHFQNRNDVVLAAIFRELNGVLDSIQDHTCEESSFAEFIVETIISADEKIRFSPVFELIVNESASLLEKIHDYGIELLAVNGIYFQERFEAAKAAGELQSDLEYDEFMKWLYHVGTSFILIPSGTQTSQEKRSMLWRYLIPAIIRMEAIPRPTHSAQL